MIKIIHLPGGEVMTQEQRLSEHLYTIGHFPPTHPVPVTMETAKYYPHWWHWIIYALARMRDKVWRAMHE